MKSIIKAANKRHGVWRNGGIGMAASSIK